MLTKKRLKLIKRKPKKFSMSPDEKPKKLKFLSTHKLHFFIGKQLKINYKKCGKKNIT